MGRRKRGEEEKRTVEIEREGEAPRMEAILDFEIWRRVTRF